MLLNYRWLILALLVIGLDQWSKVFASQHLPLYQEVGIMPFFNLTLMHNTGASFGFLSEAGGWQRYFFAGIALLASIIILVILYKLPRHRYFAAMGLALVLGGALGNLWDRITLGYVVDFLDFYYGNHHWPAFNIADSAIVGGVILLIIDSWRKQEESK